VLKKAAIKAAFLCAALQRNEAFIFVT